MVRLVVILSCIGFLYACVEFTETQQKTSEIQTVTQTVAKASEEPIKKDVSDKHKFDVHAVLDQKCSRCHGGEKTKGSFDIVRLLEKGIKQEDSESWNDVYRVLQEGDMPPEDEEQLSDEEHLQVVTTLESELESSKDVSRLLAADEIINTLSDVFDIDVENDNQMENLYSYQNHEHYSTIDNQQIMSVFFMNDFSKILDDILNEYVKLDTAETEVKLKSKKKSDKKKKEVASIYDPKKLVINNVGFASRSFIQEGDGFIDLRGRYAPHANALRPKDSKNLNLAPGKYRLTFDAATINRDAIAKISEKYNNRDRLNPSFPEIFIST